MKTVIVISGEPSNRLLYQSALKRRYSVEFPQTALEQQTATVDAIVYDISGRYTDTDLQWLAGVKVPLVVLTAEPPPPIADAPGRTVLRYPVTPDALLKALADLGVEPEE